MILSSKNFSYVVITCTCGIVIQQVYYPTMLKNHARVNLGMAILELFFSHVTSIQISMKESLSFTDKGQIFHQVSISQHLRE